MNRQSHLAKRTARGTVWMTGATVGTKVLSVVSQLILAALLAQEDFGIIALCYTLAAFAGVATQFGVREVLIRSQQRHGILLGPGLLLATGAATVAAIVMITAIPIFEEIWSEPRIAGPALILALEMPLAAAAEAVGTRLEIDMRFKTIASIQMGSLLAMAIMSVAMAAAGAGVYSFVVPKLVTTAVRLFLYWRLTNPQPRFRRARKLFPRFFGAAAPMIVGALLATVSNSADYAILGMVLTTAQVGFYYFAFVQSMQVALILNRSLGKVLLPALSSMKNESERQIRAMLQAVRLLALPAAGICVLQALLAGPFLRLLFGDRWIDSILLLQMLSLAAAPTISCWPWQVLVLSQGRYWFKALINALSAAGLVLSVLAGVAVAKTWQTDMLITVTAAVALFRLVSSPVALWLASRNGGVKLWSIVSASYRPAIGAFITIALPGYGMLQVLSDLAMLLCAPLLLILYALWLIIFEWPSTSIFLERLQSALPLKPVTQASSWIRRLRQRD